MGEITAAIPDGIKTGGSSPEATRTPNGTVTKSLSGHLCPEARDFLGGKAKC